MLDLYLNEPLYVFLVSLIAGVGLGIIYDVFRFVRKIGFDSSRLIFTEDVLFAIVVSCFVFVFTYCINEGVYRSYMFVGIILSFFIYYHTIGRLTTMLTNKIISVLRSICTFLYNNIVIRLYITIDKFYKKVKIIVELKKKARYERQLFDILLSK